MYGGLKPAIVGGREQFMRHEASLTWDDGGVAIELAADLLQQHEAAITEAIHLLRERDQEFRSSLATDLHAYGAYQVRDAIVDYLGDSEWFLTLHDGELYLVIDGSNDQATFRPMVKLDQLIMRAKTQAQQNGDSAFLGRLSDLVTALPASAAARTRNEDRSIAAPPPPSRTPGKRVQGGARGAAAR